MKKLPIYSYLVILLLVLTANPAIALRCGNDLIQEGDTTSKVRITLTNNGGEIIEKEYSGAKGDGAINSKIKGHSNSGSYTSNKKRRYTSHAEAIEKWFISAPSGYGRPYCYELTFIGSILKEIGTGVECK